jgi:hypothetical protein
MTKRTWIRLIATAACMVLIFAVPAISLNSWPPGGPGDDGVCANTVRKVEPFSIIYRNSNGEEVGRCYQADPPYCGLVCEGETTGVSTSSWGSCMRCFTTYN